MNIEKWENLCYNLYSIADFAKDGEKCLKHIIKEDFMTICKSKRILSLLCAFIMFSALSVFFCFDTAYATERSEEWEYTTVSGGASITGYTGSDTEIVVPATLENGLNVVSVSGLYSKRKDSIKSVTLSSGIKSIANSALKGYAGIEKVTIPSSVTSIGTSAFESCKSLKAISIPSSVTQLGAGAFSGCTSLTSAVINSKLSAIPERLFMNCSSLNSFTLPSNTTKIGSNAFSGCTSLKTIYFPATLTTIGASAFENCTMLGSPVLPSQKLTEIGEAAFRGCTSITSVFIPNSVIRIKDSAFYGCSSLTSAYISPSVKVLQKNALSNCNNLNSIVFGGDNYEFGAFFTTTSKPVIYYPTKYISNWNKLSYENKQSYTNYSATPSIKTVSITAGGNKTVPVIVNPTDSPLGKAYTYVSENPNVATVSTNGIIVGKSAGTTKINVTTVTGTKSAITVYVCPAKPLNVRAVPESPTSISVSWSTVKGATGYNVYRSTSAKGTYTYIGSPQYTSTKFIDKGLTKGTRYYYIVKAKTKVGTSTMYSSVSASATCLVTSPIPTGVTATKLANGKATIKWNKSIGASGYTVFMATSSTGKFTSIGSVNSYTLQFTKTGLTPGKTYYFKVCSYTVVNGKKVYSPYSVCKSVTV